MASFLFLGTENYRSEKNLNYTLVALQEIHVEFQKATF